MIADLVDLRDKAIAASEEALREMTGSTREGAAFGLSVATSRSAAAVGRLHRAVAVMAGGGAPSRQGLRDASESARSYVGKMHQFGMGAEWEKFADAVDAAAESLQAQHVAEVNKGPSVSTADPAPDPAPPPATPEPVEDPATEPLDGRFELDEDDPEEEEA